MEELARIDASAAWVVFVVCGSTFAAARMSDEAAATIHARPQDLLCGSLNPPGIAAQVESGYRLTGRWPFTSGRDHAAWLLVSAIVRGTDDATPPASDATTPIFCLVPANVSIVHDTWHTGGLRPTSSNDIEVADVFVPTSMTFHISSAGDRRSQYHQGPLYRLPLSGGIGTPIAAVALGIARRAIDEVIGIARAKTPVGRTSALRNQPVLQADVAKAEAAVRSARSWLYATADSIGELAESMLICRIRSDVTCCSPLFMRRGAPHTQSI
jgi:alkylation response protein AidB-like acyl-CoA dehydrogenase